jgi:hypothetical protein
MSIFLFFAGFSRRVGRLGRREVSVAVLRARKLYSEPVVIVFTPRTRIKTLRRVAKAKNYALRECTLERYGVVAWWYEVFRKPYRGEPRFFWTLGSFERFIEGWMAENIKTGKARDRAAGEIRGIIGRAVARIGEFAQPERGEKPAVLVIESEENDYRAWWREIRIFETGDVFFEHTEYNARIRAYEGRSYRDYICIMREEGRSARTYVWIRRDLDPASAIEKLEEEGALDIVAELAERSGDIKFKDGPGVSDAVDFLKRMLAVYQMLFL